MSDSVLHRLLVIDDNSAIHEDFRKILGRKPGPEGVFTQAESALFGEDATAPAGPAFEIDSAFQGQEGLELVTRAMQEERPYALAFVDVRMPPGWDGVETVGRLWKVAPHLQVVICTAYSDYSWDDIVKPLGHSDNLVILKKPFDNIEVLQLAHALSKKWSLTQQMLAKVDDLDRQVAARTQELQTANAQLRAEATERQLAEAGRRRSEERFAKAFASSPYPMSIHALRDARTVDANESFLAMLGRRRDETLGRGFDELEIGADSAPRQALLDDLRRGVPVRQRPGLIRAADGEARSVLWSAERFDLDDEPHLLLITQDITEQLRLESCLRQSHKMQAVGQLASGVAHDFNNLLTVIQGHVSLLLTVPSAQRDPGESLRQTLQAAEQAAALTRQLLVFSRQQATQARVIDVNQVLQRAAQMLSRLLGEQIVLQTEAAEPMPCVQADEGNLEQVIINLAVNARDAMPGGGRLLLRTSVAQLDDASAARNFDARPGPYICLSVTDTGCGMDTATLGRIFEPFFTTKDVGKGTGLGLATVYGIVKQHRGFIEVDSKVGRGTTFRVFFPATTQSAAPGHQTEFLFKAAPPSARRKTILLVEDQPLVREMARTVLSNQNYAVIEAGDGAEAIQRWAESRGAVDLLLTDVVMPNGIDGRTLAERLLAERPGLKVIYATGYSAERLGDDALQRAGVQLLSKPYQVKALLRAVHECLEPAGDSQAP